MKKEFVMSLSQSYRQDLLDAIQLAKQGMLSPSQQAYCFEEIGDTKPCGWRRAVLPVAYCVGRKSANF